MLTFEKETAMHEVHVLDTNAYEYFVHFSVFIDEFSPCLFDNLSIMQNFNVRNVK